MKVPFVRKSLNQDTTTQNLLNNTSQTKDINTVQLISIDNYNYNVVGVSYAYDL